jgi:hypothetical protein
MTVENASSEASENNSELEFDQAFDEMAQSTDATEDNNGFDVDHEDARLRDEQGRFAAKSDEEEQEQEEQSETASNKAQESINWEHRYKSDIGRQKALQQKIANQNQQLEQLRQGKKGEKPDDISESKWNEVLEDFPELAEAFDSRLKAVTAQHNNQLAELRGQLSPIQQQAENQYIERQQLSLTNEFPDYVETVNSNEFQSWLKSQPAVVQELMSSNEAAEASYLLNSFAMSQGGRQPGGRLREKRQRQLSSAESIGNRNNLRRPADEDDFDAAFEEFAS